MLLTKNYSIVKLMLLLSLSIATGFIAFISQWVWSPVWSLLFFWTVLLCDFMAALALSVKREKGFDSTKARKFALQLVAQTMALGIVFNMPRINAEFGITEAQILLDRLPPALFMFMCGYNLLSFTKNATLVGGFNGKVFDFIRRYIDRHKD